VTDPVSPLASVLIPTHDRPRTLRLAVGSVLAQNEPRLEVIIIGDGVTPELRAEALALCAADPRVRFMDREKGPNHGESYRHDAIIAAESDAIFYLCDDDLFLRDHVGDLLALLVTHNFVQSLNGHIDPDGRVRFYPADLSDPDTIAWHLRNDVQFNSVSITGTAHSKSFYLQVDEPWTTTPAGLFPDLHQWRKMFRHPGLRAATSSRMTTIQLPTTEDGRESWTPDERLAELARWAEIVAGPDAQQRIDALVATGATRQMELDMRTLFEDRISILRLRDEIKRLKASRSWRLTQPLRSARRRLGR
jgi:glycosyltransferase involved in cell wall biosynthesis